MNNRPLFGFLTAIGMAIGVPAVITLCIAVLVAVAPRFTAALAPAPAAAPASFLGRVTVPVLQGAAAPRIEAASRALHPAPGESAMTMAIPFTGEAAWDSLLAPNPGGGLKGLSSLGTATAALPKGEESAVSTQAHSMAHVPRVPGQVIDAQIIATGFAPATINAVLGDRIVWRNADGIKHTVTASDGSFDSATMAAGVEWSYVADHEGSIAYICDFHPDMQGLLVVGQGSGATETLPAAAAGQSTPAAQPTAAPTATPQPTVPAVPPTAGVQIAAQIVSGGYSPARINASIGDQITWTNVDGLKHTVTADDGAFDSGLMRTGAQWSMAVDRSGIIDYHCDLHPEMKGSIAVGGSASATRTATPTVRAQPTPQPSATQVPGSAPPSGAQIAAQIVSSGFSPSTINAKSGDQVVWTNVDRSKHTVTGDGGTFDSGTVASGGQWAWTAGAPGNYPYFCDFHSSMRGTIVVTAASSAAPPSPVATATRVPAQPAPTPILALAQSYKADISLSASSAYGGASGRVRYESRGASRAIEVELRDASSLKGASVDVLVGGTKIGSMLVGSNARASLDLSSDNGGGALPTTVAGQRVAVMRGSSTIVSGQFP